MAVNVEQLMRRHEQLKKRRTLIEPNWRECYDVTYPIRGARLALTGGGASIHADEAAAQQYARTQVAKIFDSTATDSTRILASAILSGATPANSRWVGFSVNGHDGSEDDEDDSDDEERIFLDESADIMWRNIHAANYDSVGYECMLDEVIAGLFLLFVDEDPDEGGYVFEQWPIASCWIAASKAGGKIDTVHREVWMTAEQAVSEYGETMVPDRVRQLASSSPDERVGFLQAIYPRKGAQGGYLAQNMPIASCHVELSSRKVVRESGYHEMPVIVPRWLLIPDSVYPVGPVFDALPDIRTLNKTVEMSLANLDLAVAGMWIGEDDGVLNPRSVKVGPRKVIVANSVDSFKALEPPGKFDVTALEIDRLQRAIRKVLMSNILEPQPRPGDGGKGAPITATEAQINVELIRQLLGPVYGRIMAEFLQALIDRCFGLAYRAGVFGLAPESLRGKRLVAKYTGPLARAQKTADVAAMDRYEMSLGQEIQATGRPELADNYNWDKATRTRAELLGVPAKLIPKKSDVRAARAGRAKAQQQQQMAGATLELGKEVVKKAA